MNWFLVLLGGHYIADFPLQSDFLASLKGKRWYILFTHAFIYAFVLSIAFLYLGVYADWKFGVVLLTHIIIDRWKAIKPKENWSLLYYDQAAHISINTLLYYL